MTRTTIKRWLYIIGALGIGAHVAIAGVQDYSSTAGSNTTVGGADVSEGGPAAAINNAIRGLSAELRDYADNIGGANSTTGSSNAYVLSSGESLSALEDGKMVAFVANHANTSTATLNVDSLGAKAIRKEGDVALVADDIQSGGHYEASFDESANSAAGAWILRNPTIGLDLDREVTGDWTFSGQLRVQDDNLGILRFNNTTWGGRVARIFAGNDGQFIFRPTSAADTDNSAHDFRYNNTNDYWEFQDKIRVNGTLLNNTTDTTPALNNVTDAASLGNGIIHSSKSGGIALALNRKTSDGQIQHFRREGTLVGSVAVDATSTTYNTSSDRRLKTHVSRLNGATALSRLGNLPVNVFDWNSTGQRDVGLYAQEVIANDPAIARIAVAPGSPEDVMPDDPDYQPHGIDYSKFVPLLISSVQALKAENDDLRARVAALEAQ